MYRGCPDTLFFINSQFVKGDINPAEFLEEYSQGIFDIGKGLLCGYPSVTLNILRFGVICVIMCEVYLFVASDDVRLEWILQK